MQTKMQSFSRHDADDEDQSLITSRSKYEGGDDYQQETEMSQSQSMVQRSRLEGGGDEEEQEEGQDGNEKGGEEKEKPKEDIAEGAKVGNMKAGNYTIHILVMSARQLLADGDDTCDPVVEFSVKEGKNDVEGKTTKKTDVSPMVTVKFNEHIFLELKDLTQTEAQNAILKMKVQHQGFFCGDLIGQFEIPIAKIYNMKDHTLLNQSLGLNDPESEEASKIKGFVGVSINVQGDGDDAQELSMVSDKVLMEKPPLIPTAIKKTYKQAYFRFYYGENFPITDMDFTAGFGTAPTIDAYCKVSYGTTKQRTKVYTMKDEKVIWMEELLFPIEMPIKSPIVQLQVFDEDFGKDELVCTYDLPIEDILKMTRKKGETKSQLRWLNLYGGPNDKSGATKKWMDNNPHGATEWKGRILVEYYCEEDKYPKAKMIKLKQDIAEQKLKEKFIEQEFEVFMQVSSGIALPDKDTKDNDYEIKVSLGKRSWTTGRARQNEVNFARWDFKHRETFNETYLKCENFPDVFVYLMIKGKPACYFRSKIDNFLDPNPKWQWHELTIDKSWNIVKDQWKAGFFGFRFYIHDNSKDGPLKLDKNSVWNQEFERRNRGHLVRCAIYQGSLLPPADSNGTSDPYVEIWSPSEQRQRTATSCDTNNPIYYELKEFYIEKPKNVTLEESPPIILNIFDTDEGLFDSDDFMGRAVVFLHEILDDNQLNDGETDRLPFRGLSVSDDIPYPQFFPVKRRTKDPWDPVTGPSLLLSFSIVDINKKFRVHTEDIKLEEMYIIRPGVPLGMPDLKIKEFKCKITITGMRELVSPGILPIRKAFVKFNLKSLLKAEQAKGVSNIQTQPKQGGSNPNLKTKIEFEVKVSQDETFCPQMTCDVYDQLYFEGLPQPQIGTFTLKIGRNMFDLIDDDEENKFNNDKIIWILKQLKQQLNNQSNDLENRVRTAVLLKQIRQDADSKFTSPADIKEQRKQRQIHAEQIKLEEIPSQIMDVSDQDVINQALEEPAEVPEKKDKTQKERKAEFLEEQRIKKEKEAAEREELQEQMSSSKTGFANVVWPVYKYDDRLSIDVETDAPSEQMFMPVGYNITAPADPKQGNKHYRRYYPDELENVIDALGEPLVKTPFLTETITRCQKAKKKSGGGLAGLFGGGSGDPEEDEGGEFDVINVGRFRGLLKVYNEAEDLNRKQEIYDQVLKLQQLFKECYDLEFKPHKVEGKQKKWNFDMDRIHPEKIESYEAMQESLMEMKDLLQDAGMGALKLEKTVGRFLYDVQLQKKLEKSIKCKINCYMLEGFNLAARDLFSASDPFLIVKCGDEKFDEEENYLLDEPNPKFNKCYEFQVDFPGSSALEIWVYDYDLFFGNDLIGMTQIDCDDRFFSQEWQSISNKPIEYRDIFHKDFDKAQGTLKMWVDISEVASKASQKPPWFCAGEPKNMFEARLVVWKTREIPHMDAEGCSDVYIRSYVNDPKKDKLSDTHWRNHDGKASFNWRKLFDLESLQPEYKMTVEAWDKDLIGSNELIGGFTLDIGPLFNDVYLTNRVYTLNKAYWDSYLKQKLEDEGDEIAKLLEFDGKDEMEGTGKAEWMKFWVPISRFDNEKGEIINTGAIQCTLQIYPKELAEKEPQGVGRENPNNNPYCPPPEGRIQFSLNPFKMLMQLIPPKLRRQICCAICCLICLSLCVFMGPMIFSNLISAGIAKIFDA